MFEYLKGKKTYFVVAAVFVLGGLQACGVPVAPWVYTLLAAAGLGSARLGMKKAETAALMRR